MRCTERRERATTILTLGAWKRCHVMDERLRFVARLLDGENRGKSGPDRVFGGDNP